MSKRPWMALPLLVCAFVVLAAGPGAVRKQVESSMLVTGTIDIEPDGSVSGHRLDQPEKLPKGVVLLIRRSTPDWRFEPVLVDGKAVKARARMSLRVVAKKIDQTSFNVEIRNASFGEEREAPGTQVESVGMKPPNYPRAAWSSGITGTVYLVVRIGRQGTVEDVVAEQVNLRVIGSERQMQQGRDLLAQAAVQAARHWTFKPPTLGVHAAEPFWSARIPVDFAFDDDPSISKHGQYGKWEAYVPGPRQLVPWILESADSESPDAMMAGGVYQVGQGPRLLTPLGKG